MPVAGRVLPKIIAVPEQAMNGITLPPKENVIAGTGNLILMDIPAIAGREYRDMTAVANPSLSREYAVWMEIPSVAAAASASQL